MLLPRVIQKTGEYSKYQFDILKSLTISRKRPLYWGAKGTGNQGDEHAGVVHEVGEGVYEFNPGDRVAAMHEMKTPGGSYAEYGLSPAYTTFKLPDNTSFQGE